MALIIVLRNISALADWSDYRYEVLVGDGTPERSQILERGTVTEHFRPWGWERLVEKFLKNRHIEEAVNPATMKGPTNGSMA